MLYLDHITVAALTLEQGIAHVRRALGVVVPQGGAHPLMGTHNRLMQLGEGTFLEVIAPDPEASPRRPRWFALDDPTMRNRLKESPRLVTWVARVADLHIALGDIPGAGGESVCVTRGSLSWRISVPTDGSLPLDGAFPTLIEWPTGALPCSTMPDLGCRLARLFIEHPDGVRLAASLAPFFADERVVISEAPKVQVRATIMTADGVRELI